MTDPNPAPAPNPAPNPAPAPTDWTTGLNDDLKGYVAAKGFKDPGTVLESYRNFEKLQGVPQDQILKLPGKDAKPEEWGQVWDRLGRPKEAKDYQIEMPQAGGDEKLAEWARGTFHKHGMPKAMAEAFVKDWNAFAAEMDKGLTEAAAAKQGQEAEALKKDWGAAHDQQLALAKKAAQSFGVDAATIGTLEKSMGYAGVMKMFASIGSKLGEDSFVNGDQKGGFNAMAPAAAQAEIAALKKDKGFYDKLTKGDADAKTRWDRLHQWAYPS